MNDFERLQIYFRVNWMTVLVGWEGLGVFNPAPGEWFEFPALLCANDILNFANKQLLIVTDPNEFNLITDLAFQDLDAMNRIEIRELLSPLAISWSENRDVEIRKWRVVLLERLLEEMPKDFFYGLLAVADFWSDLGFPADAPKMSDEYTEENFQKSLATHKSWIVKERAKINSLSV